MNNSSSLFGSLTEVFLNGIIIIGFISFIIIM